MAGPLVGLIPLNHQISSPALSLNPSSKEFRVHARKLLAEVGRRCSFVKRLAVPGPVCLSLKKVVKGCSKHQLPSDERYRFLDVSDSFSPDFKRLSCRRRACIRASRDGAAELPTGQDGVPENKARRGETEKISFLESLGRFMQSQFLPIVLITAVATGFFFPAPGRLAHSLGLPKAVTSAIFVLSGLTLKTEEVLKAVAAWPVLAYGIVSILLLTPLAALGVLALPLTPMELSAGLAIFCCMPTTLTSGVTLSQAAGGNSALALALTVATNLLGMLTIPFALSTLVARGSNVHLPPGPLLKGLVLTVLLPLMAGSLARSAIPAVQRLVEGNRKLLSMSSNFLLGLVPWMQVSCSRNALSLLAPTSLASAILVGIAVHVLYLVLNTAAANALLPPGGSSADVERESIRRTVVLVASQKTLPIAAVVIQQLGGALGEGGLLILPCIATHLSQILMDSMLVSFWLQQDSKKRTREMSLPS